MSKNRLTAHPPTWIPSPDQRLDLLYLAKFNHRDVLEPDDHEAAPESTSRLVFSVGGPKLTWALLKTLWRGDEVDGGHKCLICGGLQLIVACTWGGHRSPGVSEFVRRCPRCAVLYQGYVPGVEISRRIKAAAEALGYRITADRGSGFGSLALESKPGVAPADQPRWIDRLPQVPGVFVVATPDGRGISTRTVSRDPRTLRFRDEAPDPWTGWWWSRPRDAAFLRIVASDPENSDR